MWKKIALAGLLIGIIAYSLPKTADTDKAYAAQINQARKQKNQQFRTAATSPLTAAQKTAFDSLRYFAPDVNYRVSAHLHRTVATPTLTLARNDGGTDAYRHYADVDFTLPGQTQQQRLQLLQKVTPAGAQEPLFLPFADATNGQQTYGGGRYLDLPVPADGAQEITLDFNAAYNPFCAYNPEYSCPLPPAENRMSVVIEAGEQTFHK
ncbi:DUF1684 domain-containing protein [uncultured Hymenobacter sp.]|uniref:DUF1684 domain-containing protein n=1 Tax=uncultured Hymenobacter sp. TaxID=170016 RepID=UPI0035CA6B80